jgi:hypothetical protein
MQKLMIAAAITAALGALPVSGAAAADAPGKHHHARHHLRAGDYAPYSFADPAVRGDYVMNGNFDWRRRGERRPWYARGYNDDCVAWTQNAYHYACDPNNRY